MASTTAGDAQHMPRRWYTSARARPWIAAGLSVLIPGLGHLFLRKIRAAALWFLPLAAVTVVLVAFVDFTLTDLIGAALEPAVLWAVFWLNALAAVWRLLAAIDAYRSGAQADGLRVTTIGFALGWAALVLVVVAPHVKAGEYTLSALSLVEGVFQPDGAVAMEPVIPIGTDADVVPDPQVSPGRFTVDPLSESLFRAEMWDPDAVATRIQIEGNRKESAPAPFLPFNERVGERRVTILIAGGDAGPGRGGLRTDSMMVASLHTGTGKAAVFSFPRNMGSIPLPKRFGNAFIELEKRLAPPPPPLEEGEEPPEWESCECFPEQMNSIYPFTRKWTRTYPDEPDPGMAALRDVIEGLMGINIDYYMLVDMAAFVDLVDAIDGIDVYVREPLQSEVSPPREGDPWAKVDVDVGWNHLDGPEALAYARARKGSSDYARMERQRCMLRGVAAKLDPLTVLRSFPAIVDAVSGSVVTDIPRSFAAELISAGAGLDFDDIETVGFTHAYWLPERDHLFHPIPDVDRIKSKVRRVFAGMDSGETDTGGTSECNA